MKKFLITTSIFITSLIFVMPSIAKIAPYCPSVEEIQQMSPNFKTFGCGEKYIVALPEQFRPDGSKWTFTFSTIFTDDEVGTLKNEVKNLQLTRGPIAQPYYNLFFCYYRTANTSIEATASVQL